MPSTTITRITQEWECIPAGVYLDLPAEQYHADPSLSVSGIKALVASPLTYWNQHLNPERDVEESNTPAKVLGKAIHKLVLEGDDAFSSAYLVEPKPEDYPGCLQGVEALREKCGQLGLKKSGTLEEMSLRILDVEPNCLLWPMIKASFMDEVATGDRETLSKEFYLQCLEAQEAIRSNDAAKAAFTGGLPEVSVFWRTEDGVPMKSRFDYLKPQAIIDLKTFSNQNGAPIDMAVVHAVTRYLYHVQAYVYVQAAKAAKELIRSGCVYGEGSRALQQFAQVQEDPRFFFVFLETGTAMNVLVRELAQSRGDVLSLIWEAGGLIARRAIDVWKAHMQQFGPHQPWRINQPARPFMDEEFPTWAVE
ncbi:MAG: PD-(D/E)XK nuclease-like domain-containing protein [Magnetococcales bacterium]|nr:PD-(D/E)XK nuclease-like domain-containing protein [Magnetococcales bacterium]MBF0116411.1 PD-(D/E)XK nuclease-like domain-containing protein [Magnetococcales bacterium]